jgi:hypothetical protein
MFKPIETDCLNEKQFLENVTLYEKNNGKYSVEGYSITSNKMLISCTFGYDIISKLFLREICNDETSTLCLIQNGMSVVEFSECKYDFETLVVTNSLEENKFWHDMLNCMKISHRVCKMRKCKSSDKILVCCKSITKNFLESFTFYRIIHPNNWDTSSYQSKYFYSFIDYQPNIFANSRLQTFIIHNDFIQPDVKYKDYQQHNFLDLPWTEKLPSDDFNCPVCYEEKYTTVRYSCFHNVCYDCFVELKPINLSCPMCRNSDPSISYCNFNNENYVENLDPKPLVFDRTSKKSNYKFGEDEIVYQSIFNKLDRLHYHSKNIVFVINYDKPTEIIKENIKMLCSRKEKNTIHILYKLERYRKMWELFLKELK